MNVGRLIALELWQACGFGEFWPAGECGGDFGIEFFEFTLVHPGVGGSAGKSSQSGEVPKLVGNKPW